MNKLLMTFLVNQQISSNGAELKLMACDQKIVNVTLDAPVSLLLDNIYARDPTWARYKTKDESSREQCSDK